MTNPWWEDCCDDPDGIDEYDAFMREKYWVIEQLRKLHLPETPRELFNENHAYDLLVDDEAEKWKPNYWADDKAAVIDALVRSDIRYPNTGVSTRRCSPKRCGFATVIRLLCIKENFCNSASILSILI